MSCQISLSRVKPLDGAIISGSLGFKYIIKVIKCQGKEIDESSLIRLKEII
jgi:hypothetical protein